VNHGGRGGPHNNDSKIGLNLTLEGAEVYTFEALFVIIFITAAGT